MGSYCGLQLCHPALNAGLQYSSLQSVFVRTYVSLSREEQFVGSDSLLSSPLIAY